MATLSEINTAVERARFYISKLTREIYQSEYHPEEIQPLRLYLLPRCWHVISEFPSTPIFVVQELLGKTEGRPLGYGEKFWTGVVWDWHPYWKYIVTHLKDNVLDTEVGQEDLRLDQDPDDDYNEPKLKIEYRTPDATRMRLTITPDTYEGQGRCGLFLVKDLDVPKREWHLGIMETYVSSYPDEVSHVEDTYQKVAELVLTPPSGEKITLLKVEFDCRVSYVPPPPYEVPGGLYKITCQKEGEAETDIVTGEPIAFTAYVTYMHDHYLTGDVDRNITIRFYTKVLPELGIIVYSRNHQAKYNVLPKPVTIETETRKCFPSLRYSVRHGVQLGYKHYWYGVGAGGNKEPEISIAKKMISILDDYGYTCDIYDPIYRASDGYPDNFFFLRKTYHDTEIFPCGPVGPYFYPYWSKVNLGPDLYISNSHFDPLLKALEAIHCMNKYNSITVKDAYGCSALDYLRGVNIKYPKNMGCEWHWADGLGIQYPGDSYATTRLAVFLIAEAEAGYGFGDSTSKTYADKAADILVKLQWLDEGETYKDGVIKRPDHYGGFLVLYEKGVTKPYRLARAGWIREFTDMFAMPTEFEGSVPTNIESTLIAQRALNIYKHYKYKGLTGRFLKAFIPGDANDDGKVTVSDLVILGKHWYTKEGDPNWDPRADFNDDGKVTVSDLVILGKHWYTKTCDPSRKLTVTVPVQKQVRAMSEQTWTSTIAAAMLYIFVKGLRGLIKR